MVDHLKQAKNGVKTEENVRKIKKLFAELNQVIDAQREEVISQMEVMPLDQQEAVVHYWEGVENLLSEILDGLYKQFLQALERIKRGEKLDKKALRAYFDEIYEAFKIMFTPEKYIRIEQNPVHQHANNQYVNNQQYNQKNKNAAVGRNDNKDSSGNNLQKSQINDETSNNSQRSDNRSEKKSNESCSKDKLDIHDSNLKTHLGNKNAAVGRNDNKDSSGNNLQKSQINDETSNNSQRSDNLSENKVIISAEIIV